MDAEQSAVKSAVRVFDLLELLAPRAEGLTHTVIADALGIPKSSLTQLLKTAAARGYVSFDSKLKAYRLGGKLEQLSRRSTPAQELMLHAEAALRDITEKTLESSALNFLNGDFAEVVASVYSPQRLTSHMKIGELAPLYATSGGKILLTNLTDDEFAEYVKRAKIETITNSTITSAEELRLQLKKIKQEKIAFSFEEFTPGIVGIATAITTSTGGVIASLNIAMPTVRFNNVSQATAIEALRHASARLEARIQL